MPRGEKSCLFFEHHLMAQYIELTFEPIHLNFCHDTHRQRHYGHLNHTQTAQN